MWRTFNLLIIEIIYGALFVLALFSALMVVLAPHPLYNALYLVLTMVAIAGQFVLMNAELAAAFQIIVYAGAIMVLFIFVIMLLNLNRQSQPAVKNRTVRILGLLFTLAFIVQIMAIIGTLAVGNRDTTVNFIGTDAKTVGVRLIADYVYAFEMTSVLLLIAVVGAIVLARRHLIQGADDEDVRGQRPAPLVKKRTDS
jgi:NADH-quinone oxidoreductase subunit J